MDLFFAAIDMEQRVQVAAKRFRVPGLCVLVGPEPREQVLTSPPFLCIEILSKDDRMTEMQEHVNDYLRMGVRFVWLINPKSRQGYVHTVEGSREVKDGVLRTENPSRNGEWIYFSCDRTGRPEVWRIPATGGQAVKVTQNGGSNPRESPDGHSLYYLKPQRTGKIDVDSLWRAPLSPEGRVRKETRLLDSIWACNFAVLEQGVYVIPESESGSSSSIQFLDFATGKVRKIFQLPRRAMLGVLRVSRRPITPVHVTLHGIGLDAGGELPVVSADATVPP